MNYKDTLFFNGESVTLDSFPERIPKIRRMIKSGDVDWEQFVWVGSNQLMLPAVYMQFKRADLLKELDAELVEHMHHIYQLNFERNEAILKQTKTVIKLLNKHQIYPLFLKGVGNILDNLYQDIGERMIGDIDFLLPENEVIPAAEILKKDGYKELTPFSEKALKYVRHYPRLIKDSEIASVEIHHRIVKTPYDKKLNFDIINQSKKKLKIEDIAYVLSDAHQIIFNMMIVQMNDNRKFQNHIYLKHSYDLLLLSKRNEPLKTIGDFGFYFQRLNNYLAMSSILLGRPESLVFKENKRTAFYIQKQMIDIRYVKWARLKMFLFYRPNAYLTQFIQAFYKRSVRYSLSKHLSKHLFKYKS